MSVTATTHFTAPSESHKTIYRGNSYQWKNHSGELDVFEAARYFSGVNETPGYVNDFNFGQNYIRNVKRLSLDMPKRNSVHHDQNPASEKQMKSENKKHKQPSSPGARIASFFNSLYQKSLKKKKSKSSGMNDILDDENRENQRRKRRSISHFPVISYSKIVTDSKSISGLATCHLYSNTPLKSCKDFRSFADPFNYNKISVPKNSESFKPGEIRTGIPEKIVLKNLSFEFTDHRHQPLAKIDKEYRKFSDGDKGGDSDSSSDLFDLPNYHDRNFCSSSGLPVYETTQMEISKKISFVYRNAAV